MGSPPETVANKGLRLGSVQVTGKSRPRQGEQPTIKLESGVGATWKRGLACIPCRMSTTISGSRKVRVDEILLSPELQLRAQAETLKVAFRQNLSQRSSEKAIGGSHLKDFTSFSG